MHQGDTAYNNNSSRTVQQRLSRRILEDVIAFLIPWDLMEFLIEF